MYCRLCLTVASKVRSGIAAAARPCGSTPRLVLCNMVGGTPHFARRCSTTPHTCAKQPHLTLWKLTCPVRTPAPHTPVPSSFAHHHRLGQTPSPTPPPSRTQESDRTRISRKPPGGRSRARRNATSLHQMPHRASMCSQTRPLRKAVTNECEVHVPYPQKPRSRSPPRFKGSGAAAGHVRELHLNV